MVVGTIDVALEGGAIVGGVLMGGAGAVVGGLSGNTKQNKVVNNMDIKIALLQLLPGETLEENLEIGIKACREA